ncbi:MAG: ABC transporter permease [Spirochaetaceae bacterium]|nr:ABC transporter permease [Spirochaetaceae bacterium]
MHNETVKIISRRFQERILESGLLIIAVALGIGAASSGIALLGNTISTSKNILEAPAYRELIVSTLSEADDMDEPVSLKPLQESAVLTSSDLDTANLAPYVSYSYVENDSRLHFINEESISREAEREAERMEQIEPSPQESGQGGNGDNPDAPPKDGPQEYSEDEFSELSGQDNILIAELDEAKGFEVTPDYFIARDYSVIAGSVFSEQDMNGNSSIVVLGRDLAELLVLEGDELNSLLGKKLLTREGLVTIIGILDSKGESEYFYSPYRSEGSGDFRRGFMNTKLIFSVGDPARLDETAAQLQQWFDSQFGENQVVISNPRSEAEQLISRNTGIALLILFLSLSGLFIASVNVSNILMSRSMRMKKHVGILMALGSSRAKIIQLFTLESLAITAAGATLGTILSLPLGQYMQSSLDINHGTLLFTLMGVLLSAALTLLFGLFPTRQFTKIDPAMAMRAA